MYSLTNWLLFGDLFCNDRKFFERIILCNSLVWSCEITGQGGLTYQEAVAADRRARCRLADFPEALRRPLLLLMQMTRRRKITDARDDIFLFVNKHFFVDEEVMAAITTQDRLVCRILSHSLCGVVLYQLSQWSLGYQFGQIVDHM